MQSTQPPSQIPAVHREDSHSHLYEMYAAQDDFSDQADGVVPTPRPIFRQDPYAFYSHVDRGHARPQIPVSINSSSVSSYERIGCGQYYEADEPVYQGSSESDS
jgi:hypothetical protein